MIVSELKEYASESCHAYDWEGNPHHQVPYADKKRAGEFRNTTLRDIKKNGWLPSVSSILSIQAKPGLDNWKKERVAAAALLYPYRPFHEDPQEKQEYINFLVSKAEEHMSKARDLGTEIHGAIEKFLGLYRMDWSEGAVGLPHPEHIKAAVRALKDFGAWGQPFRAERSFACPLGYGGCLDFCTDTHIVDFKCCDSLSKKLDYNDRLAQLSAYSMGVHGKLVKCANVFISTSEPGQYLLREWTMEELEWGWNLFMACKHLWEVSNRYIPVLNAQEKGVSKEA